MRVTFELNGRTHTADTTAGESLLEYLRHQGFVSVKHGCDKGNCGACTVLIDGRTRNACLVLVQTLIGHAVETLENFNLLQELTPLQESFLNTGAVQCGYCTPAMLLAMEALRRRNPTPDEKEVREALAGILCRCTGYVKPVQAALKVAGGDAHDH